MGAVTVSSIIGSRLASGRIKAVFYGGDIPQPSLGQSLDVYASALKKPRKLATGRVVLSARVFLEPTGPRRFTDLHYTPDTGGEGLALLLRAAEAASPEAARHADKLAEALGFKAWASLWRAESRGAAGIVLLGRNLVAWEDR